MLTNKQLEYTEVAEQDGSNDFELARLPGFPYDVYTDNKSRYTSLRDWFSGEALNARQTQGNATVDKYPIKFNPIRGACFKHASALFGEVNDDSRPLVVPKVKPDKPENKDIAQDATEILYKIWWENSGRSLMIRNGLLSQIFGGCVFKLSELNRNDIHSMRLRTIPIQIEIAHPSNWVGIPYTGEEFLLQESWIIKLISAKQARELGVEVNNKEGTAWYVEYCSPDEMKATINGKSIPRSIRDFNGNPLFYEGKNPYGFVPHVYIPHIRTSSFYGDPLITSNVTGIVEELNARQADVGDASSSDSHKDYRAIDMAGKPEVFSLSDGSRVINIKSSAQLGGNQIQAKFEELSSNRSSEPMRLLTNDLYDLFRREAFIPAVADGEDEGSQRSALTLAMRMWPLTSHTGMERILWSDGLAVLQNMIMRMIVTKELISEFPKKTIGCRIEHKWAPVLPKDREMFINELVNRASANLGSLQTLLAKLDDIEDPKEEEVEIKKYLKWMAELDASKQPAGGWESQQPANKSGQKSTQKKQLVDKTEEQSKSQEKESE